MGNVHETNFGAGPNVLFGDFVCVANWFNFGGGLHRISAAQFVKAG